MERTDRAGRPIRLAVNTQTPLVRLRNEDVLRLDRVHLDDLLPDGDYKFTAGGVTRMLLPLLSRGLREGRLASAEWVALAAGERQPSIDMPAGFSLRFVGMPREERRGYARVKEHLWALLNGLPPPEEAPSDKAWDAFLAYQARSAREMQASSHRMGGLDLAYVHDFQQMGVGAAWQGPRAPRLFHLHTPFPARMPEDWRGRVADFLSHYDAVVCSTQRYATNLRAAGLRVPIHVVPPFIDARDYPEPSDEEVAALRARFDLRPDEPVILHIGRMDPMKGQDRLIRMMPRVLEEVPDARLVLIGNGSFSSSKQGGLGLSKGARWRAHLESLTKELGVEERVTFTGHLDDAACRAALSLCRLFVLPSTREGFGLAAVEAWRYRKPVVVSQTAGVSHLVDDGSNGIVADCGDAQALARHVVDLIEDDELREAMGEAGFETSRVATLDHGERELRRIFRALIEQEGPRALV